MVLYCRLADKNAFSVRETVFISTCRYVLGNFYIFLFGGELGLMVRSFKSFL